MKKICFYLTAALLLGFGGAQAQENPESEFTPLFNGQNLDGWIGNKTAYRAENGMIVIDPKGGGGGNLFTEKEYGMEGDYLEASKNGTLDQKKHPGLQRSKGHIGFLGHGDVVQFRNIRIKELPATNN